jgi:hypothetical protein
MDDDDVHVTSTTSVLTTLHKHAPINLPEMQPQHKLPRSHTLLI